MTHRLSLIAAISEMERLRNASAWSPVNEVTSRRRNQYVTRYKFADSSVLSIYSNGDASWFYRDERGQTDGEQRWPRWHSCNTTSKAKGISCSNMREFDRVMKG